MRTTTQQSLGQALAALETGIKREITAPKAYAAHQAREAERLTYAEARADLEARARAGDTTMVRDSTGRFTAGVKVSHFGPRPAAPAKVAKVETRPATVERDRRASVVGLSAEV